MGPVEKLVLDAWALGIRIDTDPTAKQVELVALVDRARAIDGDEERCPFQTLYLYTDKPAKRCVLPNGHKGGHKE